MAGRKKPKVSKAVRDYMRELGKRGAAAPGKGGKKSLETMTPEARTARAQKAAAKSALVRTEKARAKAQGQPPKKESNS